MSFRMANLTKFDIYRNVRIKLIFFSAKAFKKLYIKISVNSFCKATTTPSPLYAEASFFPQKQNNVREYFQTDAKLSFI